MFRLPNPIVVWIALAGTGIATGCGDTPNTPATHADTVSTPSQGNGALDGPDPGSSNAGNPDNSGLWLCGNGTVDPGELCDPGSPQKPCPVTVLACNDLDPCTIDILLGQGCKARCQHTPNLSTGQDGCCPDGDLGDPDCEVACTDCIPTCGNGALDADELCDTAITTGPGVCPTSCPAPDSCTTAYLVGQSCQAECITTMITTSVDADGCCPSGANANDDTDCVSECGNQILEPGEHCDGDCPTGCDDQNPCTTDVLTQAGTCLATCEHTAVVQVGLSDGCCPQTATTAVNALTDPDCPPVCGNGVKEGGETCDPGPNSTSPCPTTCDAADPCTIVQLNNGGTCNATCTVIQTLEMSGDVKDGCCPLGGNSSTDKDCNAVCGNGTVETGELCDTAVLSGPGMCPEPNGCTDLDPCTTDVVEWAQPGNPCTAQCKFTALTPCCGNGKVEPAAGELCDLAIDATEVGKCPDLCPAPTSCSTATLVDAGTCKARCEMNAQSTGLADEWFYTQLFYELHVKTTSHADFETHGDMKTSVVAAEPVAIDEYVDSHGFTVEYVGQDPSGHIAWWGTPETGYALRVNCNNYAGCFPPGQHGIRITFVKEPVVTVAMKFPANTNATVFDISGTPIAQKSAGGKGDSFLAYVSSIPIGAVQLTDPGGESMKDLWFSSCND